MVWKEKFYYQNKDWHLSKEKRTRNVGHFNRPDDMYKLALYTVKFILFIFFYKIPA